jgi:hypothetical protein
MWHRITPEQLNGYDWLICGRFPDGYGFDVPFALVMGYDPSDQLWHTDGQAIDRKYVTHYQIFDQAWPIDWQTDEIPS